MKKAIIITFFLLFSIFVNSQKPAFWNEIQSFKKQDSISMTIKGTTLFVGSSSFTKWKSMQKDLPKYNVINRGFGGSSLPDIIYYQKEIIDCYSPSQIVIYCGENDLTGSSTISGKIVFDRFEKLFISIREKFPNIHIYYISMKPSPSRWSLKYLMVDGNMRIKEFCKTQNNLTYIDVWDKMLKDGTPNTALFLKDRLHMNSNGYKIWIKEINKHVAVGKK